MTTSLDLNNISKGAFWQLCNVVLFFVQNFIYLMIMARLVAQDQHGIFVIINSLIVFVTLFSEGGISSALIQNKDSNRYHLSVAFYGSIILSLIFYALLVIASEGIVDFYDKKFTINMLYIIGFNLVVLNLGKVSNSLLIGQFKFRKIFLVNNISYFVSHLCLGVFLAFNNFGVWAFIYAVLVFSGLKTIFFYVCEPHSIAISFKRKEASEVFGFGLIYTLIRAMHYISYQVDKLLLGKYYSLDFLALYEKGLYLSQLPGSMIGNVLDPVLFSSISKFQEDDEKIRNIYELVVTLALFFTIYIFATLFFFSESIALLVLGAKWVDAGTYLKIFSFLVLFQVPMRMCDILVRSKNKMLRVLPVKIVYLIIVVFICVNFKNTLSLIDLAKIILLIMLIHSIVMIIVGANLIKYSFAKFMFMLKIPSLFFAAILLKTVLFKCIFMYFNLPILVELPLLIVTDFLLCVLFFVINKKRIMQFIHQKKQLYRRLYS